MKENFCEFENKRIGNFSTAAGDENFLAHAKNCPKRQDALTVASWMKNFAVSSTGQKSNLPSAGFLWWKARLLEKQEAGKRAAQPVILMQAAAVILVFAACLWLMNRFQRQVSTVLENFSASLDLIAAPFFITFVFTAFICFIIIRKWREPSQKN